jgi:hypothetical protein
VVKGIRQSVTKRRLFGAKRKTLRGVANYLYRNRLRMRYDEYLAKGWRIASGPVEGTCENLVKNRMERSGMRWTGTIAEAILQLGAVYLSGDFDSYWSFHIERDQQRIHPSGQWRRRSKVDTPITILVGSITRVWGQYSLGVRNSQRHGFTLYSPSGTLIIAIDH